MTGYMDKDFASQINPRELFNEQYRRHPFEPWFKFGGLLTNGVNLKDRYGSYKVGTSFQLKRLYSRILCTFFWLFTFRQFILMFIDDRFIQLMLGDITSYWNSYRMYFLMPSFFMGLQMSLCYTVFLTKENSLGWIVPFLSIRQLQVRNSRITMDHRPYNVRIYSCIIACLILGIGIGLTVGYAMFDTSYLEFDDYYFRMFLPWIVIQAIWFFYFSLNSYLIVTYFSLVCMVMGKRFNIVSVNIEELSDSDPGPVGSKNDQINQLYFDHNEVCELVDESNSFWQTYIFVTFMTYIPCACYVLYNLFFADFDEILGFFTWGVFLHTILILVIICISAADVSSEAHAPYTALHTLSLLQLPIDLEVNMSTFLHRVRGPTIGYSCLDLFVVTNSSISNTVAAVASYFLIVADFSRSTMTNRYRNQAPDNTTLTTLSQFTNLVTGKP